MDAENIPKYKAEIHIKLIKARDVIEDLIGLVEANESWKHIHTQTEYAVNQLQQSTKLLARYHLKVCIPKKRKHRRGRLSENDMREIIKTFNYMG